MGVLSKLKEKFIHVDEDCDVVAHTWDSSCIRSTLSIGLTSFIQGLRLYGPLFLISSLLSGELRIKKIIRNTLQSSLFLSLNCIFTLSNMCIFRKLLGAFYQLTIVFLPTLIGSTCALLAERPSRRNMLASYVFIQAIDSLHRFLKFKGWRVSVPYGDVLLFMLSSGIIMSLNFAKEKSDDYISKIFSGILESENMFIKLTPYSSAINSFYNSYSVLKTNPLIDIIGAMSHVFLLSACIDLIFFLYSKFFSKKNKDKDGKKSHLWSKLCIAVPIYIGVFKTLIKLFIKYFGAKHQFYYALISGMFAGSSILFYRSPYISLYLLVKSLELVYAQLCQKGYAFYIPHFNFFLYSMSTAFLFNVVILMPPYINYTYLRFCLSTVGNALVYFNHPRLACFGVQNTEIFDTSSGLWPANFINLKNYF